MILQKINRRAGFTLIELMIVICIIAICLAVVVPMVGIMIERGEADTDMEIVDQTDEEVTQDVAEPPEEKEAESKL